MSLSVGGRRSERGAVAVVVGLLSVTLFMVAALVVDLGFARDVKRQSQSSADASALAAAGALYPSGVCMTSTMPAPPCLADAVDEAKAYAGRNFGVTAADWAACSDPDRPADFELFLAASTPCISFDDLANPQKVRVRVPVHDVPTGLGALAGVSRVPVSTLAVANVQPGEAHSCGLCVIGTGMSDLGNGGVIVSGGSVHLNGSVNTNTNGELKADSGGIITVVGSVTGTGSIDPQATPGQHIDDPLAATVLPAVTSGTYKAPGTNPCGPGGGPGRYSGYTWGNNDDCTLAPGLYVITGLWELGNHSWLRGTGVTLFFICGTASVPLACPSTGQPGGALDAKNGQTDLVAPSDPSNPLTPFVIIYDRNNTSPLNLQGNGETSYTGTIYALHARMEFPGTSSINVTNGPVVIDSLYGNGNTGELKLHSVHSASLPPSPGEVTLYQ